MSLLMEALRKAEEAKRKVQNQNNPPADSPESNSAESLRVEQSNAESVETIAFSLTPRQVPAEPDATDDEPGSLPETSVSKARDELRDYLADDHQETQGIDEEVPPPRSARATMASGPTRDQQAAAAVFAAKSSSASKKSYVKPLLLSLALLLPLTGAGLWYLSNMNSSGINLNPSLANYNIANREAFGSNIDAQGATAAPTPALADQSQSSNPALAAMNEDITVSAGDALASTNTIVQVVQQMVAASAPPSEPEQPAKPASTPAFPVTATSTPATQEADLTPAMSDSQLAGRLSISRVSARPEINKDLLNGYQSYNQGNLAQARSYYQQAVTAQPNNRDALLGLAAVLSRTGDKESARTHYLHLLELNPQDPLARTGLLQNVSNTVDSRYENELKALLNKFPDLAPASFALGNYYAAALRWNEAQEAYFNALLNARRSNPDSVSPDFAFNLAVSLEQLHQPAAALNYYKQAQELARTNAPGFATSLLNDRLNYLEQVLP